MATFVFKDNLKPNLDLHYAVVSFDVTISVNPWDDPLLSNNTMYIQTQSEKDKILIRLL